VTLVSPVLKEFVDLLVRAESPVEWVLPDNLVFPVSWVNLDHLDLQDPQVQ